MIKYFTFFAFFFASMAVFFAHAYEADGVAKTGLALHGDPKYGASQPFSYVNTLAPKGGVLHLGAVGTFDSLNPFILKGISAPNIGMTFETLMEQSADEPFSVYGHIAKTVAVFKDKVVFALNEKAKFSDGAAITPRDVVFTFETLKAKGAPFYRSYFAAVTKIEAQGNNVVFYGDMAGNRELPLILGQLPVLSEQFFKKADFEKTTLAPILGSGPYVVDKVDAGRSISFKRNPNWWAQHEPRQQGRYNFDVVTVDMYRDTTVAIEAFMAGRFDVRQENVAKVWANAYEGKAVQEGRIIKASIENGLPAGLQAFAMNTRRPVFADPAVRAALQYVFDFEWANKQLAYGAYKRSYSYFTNSDLAATGLPSAEEVKLLEPFRASLPPEVFTTVYEVPKTDGSGNARPNLVKAASLLKQAGYSLNGAGVLAKNNVALQFEILGNSPDFERWVLPFIRNLKKLGIVASFRVVDDSQYVNRMQNFDFDMTVHGMPQSLSPGNEQYEYWNSKKADEPGSRNVMGIKNAAVDALVQKIISASDRAQLQTACRALDRVLLWGNYAIPQWYINTWRVAYWNKFGRPKTQAPYDLGMVDTWWVKP